MKVCPYLKQCSISLGSHPMTVVWQANYCLRKKKYPLCARFQMAEQGAPIPTELMPNGTVIKPPA